MTFAEELKLTVQKFPWALTELVYALKMMEWNELSNGGRKCMLRWLKENQVVVGERQDLEDLILQVKEGDVHQLMKSNNEMFAYLKAQYGGGQEVLNTLRVMLRTQKEPRKSVDFLRRYAKATNT